MQVASFGPERTFIVMIVTAPTLPTNGHQCTAQHQRQPKAKAGRPSELDFLPNIEVADVTPAWHQSNYAMPSDPRARDSIR